MRFYRIDITDSKTGAPVLPSSLRGQKLTSLNADGSFNPGALNIEIDVTQFPSNVPTGASYCRIWGIGIADLGQAFNLGASPTQPGANIAIYGGMSKGLPLANPAQSGLLVRGSIFQCFGNWIGTDMTLDLILGPSIGTVDAPFNFVLNWQAGTTLANALTSTLNTVYPLAQQKIAINSRLTLNYDETGQWQTLEQMAQWLSRRTKSIITDPGYPGVSINYDGTTVTAYDFSGPPNPVKAIAFQDLIGQPTWIDVNTIQAKVVMRADMKIQDLVSLPKGLVTTTAQAFTQFQDKTNFTGNYQVIGIHHFGNFRQSDAASWNTTLNMIPEIKNGG